jgi:hypothetical protein
MNKIEKTKVIEPKWLVMMYNYPEAFVVNKKDFSTKGFNWEEKESVKFIKIKTGQISE